MAPEVHLQLLFSTKKLKKVLIQLRNKRPRGRGLTKYRLVLRDFLFDWHKFWELPTAIKVSLLRLIHSQYKTPALIDPQVIALRWVATKVDHISTISIWFCKGTVDVVGITLNESVFVVNGD